VAKESAVRADLARAVDRLDEACRRFAATVPSDPLIRDGLIQRFEFCFELAWKAVARANSRSGTPLLQRANPWRYLSTSPCQRIRD
jgi:hypothetical protein